MRSRLFDIRCAGSCQGVFYTNIYMHVVLHNTKRHTQKGHTRYFGLKLVRTFYGSHCLCTICMLVDIFRERFILRRDRFCAKGLESLLKKAIFFSISIEFITSCIYTCNLGSLFPSLQVYM